LPIVLNQLVNWLRDIYTDTVPFPDPNDLERPMPHHGREFTLALTDRQCLFCFVPVQKNG